MEGTVEAQLIHPVRQKKTIKALHRRNVYEKAAPASKLITAAPRNIKTHIAPPSVRLEHSDPGSRCLLSMGVAMDAISIDHLIVLCGGYSYHSASPLHLLSGILATAQK
jgi:hypothetical protein